MNHGASHIHVNLLLFLFFVFLSVFLRIFLNLFLGFRNSLLFPFHADFFLLMIRNRSIDQSSHRDYCNHRYFFNFSSSFLFFHFLPSPCTKDKIFSIKCQVGFLLCRPLRKEKTAAVSYLQQFFFVMFLTFSGFSPGIVRIYLISDTLSPLRIFPGVMTRQKRPSWGSSDVPNVFVTMLG